MSAFKKCHRKNLAFFLPIKKLKSQKSVLLSELKNLRAQRDDYKPVILLCRPTLVAAPETNEVKADLFLSLFLTLRSFVKFY